MSKCLDCKFYAAAEGFDSEESDRCHNDKSGHLVGGIREESRIVFYTCETMLKGFCDNHKLFEPKA